MCILILFTCFITTRCTSLEDESAPDGYITKHPTTLILSVLAVRVDG